MGSSSAQLLHRELAMGVLAVAFMWAACWMLITLRYASFAPDAASAGLFVLSASVGQLLSLLVCAKRFAGAALLMRSVGATLALSLCAAASLTAFLFSGVRIDAVTAGCGMLYGLVMGVLWVNAALFLSSRDPGGVARCLSIGSLVGGALIVCCLLLVPVAGAVLAVVLLPASFCLYCASCRGRATEKSEVELLRDEQRRPVRERVREFWRLYLIIVAFAFVFGFQIGTQADGTDLSRFVVGASFLVPGVVLLVLFYGMKRSVNLRTLCLVILLCSVAALLPWLSGDGVAAIVRTLAIYASFTLFDLSAMATLIEVGRGDVPSRAVPVVIGRFAVMVAVTAGMGVANALAGSDAVVKVVDSVAILLLIAVFSLFAIMREMLASHIVGDVPSPHRKAVESIASAHRLTEREQEVFALLAKGYNVKRIAEELTLSGNTVKTHQAHVYAKLEVHTHQELIRFVEREMHRASDGRP